MCIGYDFTVTCCNSIICGQRVTGIKGVIHSNNEHIFWGYEKCTCIFHRFGNL